MKILKQLLAILILHSLLIISAKAQIVYTDVVPDDTIGCTGNCTTTYNLDLDNNGIIDFNFVLTDTLHGTLHCGMLANSLLKITPLNNNEVLGDASYMQPLALSANSTVDSTSLTWSGISNQLMDSIIRYCLHHAHWGTPGWWTVEAHSYGHWPGATDKYLGLMFHIGSTIHYGWVHLSLSGFIVKDYAYNLIPNQSILAGQGVFTASITSNPSICHPGDTTTLTVIGGNSYLWNTGASTGSLTLSPLTTSTYTVTVTDTLTGNSIVVSQQVMIVTIDTSVAQVSCNILFSKELLLNSIQWFDCNTQQPIPGAINSSYIPSSPGYYFAIIWKNGCTDTTPCYYASGINFSVAGNTTICPGDSVTLLVSNGNSFTWSTGDTTSSITVSPASTTTYTVSVTDTTNTCTRNYSQQITVNTINTSVTQPDCNTLISQESLPVSIQWYDCNTLQQIPGATNSIFIPSSPGLYSAIISKNGCIDTTACYNTAIINFSVVGDTLLCPGESTTLSVTGGNLFSWSTGATMPSINVSPPITSTYYVLVTDTIAGCSTNFSQQITVNWFNTLLTQIGDTLFTNAGPTATYQWMDCATMQIIPGATSATFLASSSGSYAAIITKDGCTDTSACVPVIGLGINEQQNNFEISILPNPFSNSTTISFSLKQQENISIKVYDVDGRLVKTLANSKFAAGAYSIDWNVRYENVDAGIYFLKIETEKYSETKKLSVVK